MPCPAEVMNAVFPCSRPAMCASLKRWNPAAPVRKLQPPHQRCGGHTNAWWDVEVEGVYRTRNSYITRMRLASTLTE